MAIRISEILDYTTMNQWRWVPTKENPADIATKKVANDAVWFSGPMFLNKEETMWPVSRVQHSTNEEERFFAYHREATTVLDKNRYSYWDKLVKHLTYLKKIVNFLQNKEGFRREIRP